jgi:LacI family transcriptional regulator
MTDGGPAKMQRTPTIRDVAADAGVSIAVVSRVLNDGSGPVAASTRERVLASMSRLNYRPRTAARELKARPQTTLGLLLADVTNPFFARLADHVVREARSRGVSVILMTTQEDPRYEAEAIDTLAARRVNGVIATPTSTNASEWTQLSELGSRLVFVDRVLGDVASADAVSIDNVGSARTATRHLLELGHRRIGFISGPESSSTGAARVEGYRHELAAEGIEFDPALVRPIPFRGDQGGDAVGALLALPEPPTAMIVANTAQALSSMRRLHLAGTRIPDDLSVVIFDDNPWTELFTPALTVVRQPVALLAAHSVDLALTDRAAANEARHTVVESEFVARSSTAPLA